MPLAPFKAVKRVEVVRNDDVCTHILTSAVEDNNETHINISVPLTMYGFTLL